MKDNHRQFQSGIEQYTVPDAALRQAIQDTYNVGYEATTGNDTEQGKKTDNP